MKKPIPVLCITGFLGSGKTTLINRLLQLTGIPKLGVLVNEFGQVGIDGTLLGPQDIVEMSGGCVCCASGEELWDAGKNLIDKANVECLIIETSGIANPQVLIEQFEQLPKELATMFYPPIMVCVLDPTHFFKMVNYPETSYQLSAAHCIVFSKQDLTSSKVAQLVHQKLDELCVSSHRTALGIDASSENLRDMMAWFQNLPNGSMTPSKLDGKTFEHTPQIQSVSLQFSKKISKPLFIKFFEQLGQKCLLLRAKGIVYFAESDDSQPQVFHWVMDSLEINQMDELSILEEAKQGMCQLVFIGQGLKQFEISAMLQSCCVG